MVKRKTVSMSRSRGTVHRHQAYQARCAKKLTQHQTHQGPRAKKLAQHQTHLGPRAKNSPNTPLTAIFRPFFPRWANFFAFAFTSDRTGRTFSRPEHRDVITVKPTASLNARPGTKLSQQPPSHTLPGTKLSPQPPSHTHPGTKLSQRANKRLLLPKMHQQGEFCTARRAQKPSRENFVPAIVSSRLHHR